MSEAGFSRCSTSYSLAGQVILTIPALPRVLQNRLREVRVAELQWEGMSEYFDGDGKSNLALHAPGVAPGSCS